MQIVYLNTKIGKIIIKGCEKGIHMVQFINISGKNTFKTNHIDACYQQLELYFKQSLKQFDLTLYLQGTTFQKKVWNTLNNIPYGKTASYSTIARKLGDINKTRAVGLANSKNPIAIIVPCHRVIGANGNLTGYAGGLERKRWLLELEGAITQTRLF